MKIKFSTDPNFPEHGTVHYDVIETLKYLIEKKGTTVKALAEKIDIPASQLEEELQSTDSLQLSTLKALFEPLDVHISYQGNLLFSLELDKASDYFKLCITHLMVDSRDAQLKQEKEKGYKIFRDILDMGIDNGLVEAIADLKKEKDRIKKINELEKIYGINGMLPPDILRDLG